MDHFGEYLLAPPLILSDILMRCSLNLLRFEKYIMRFIFEEVNMSIVLGTGKPATIFGKGTTTRKFGR